MMNKVEDFRAGSSVTGLVFCTLAQESARITDRTFQVHIPSMMGGTEPNTEPTPEKMEGDYLLNTECTMKDSTEVETMGAIEAKNFCALPIRLDGWIPEFKIEKLTAENIKISNTNGNLTTETTQMAGQGPHNHKTDNKSSKYDNVEGSTVEMNTLVATTSTSVDLQNIHRKFIKKGHRMVGAFVNGGKPHEFVILGIEGVMPYTDNETEDPGEQNKYEDTAEVKGGTAD